MILAAGRGERMRPLTDRCPKPLLKAGGKPLIQHHIERCASAGYQHLVINTHYLGEQIQHQLGDGSDFGVSIAWSPEQPQALETGGGIFQALPLLGSDPFLVINGDIWCDHPLSPPQMDDDTLAHLVLVDNPSQHPQGDFALHAQKLSNTETGRLTFSGIGWYRHSLFQNESAGRFPLAPLLRQAIDQQQISGEHFHGQWMDIGTRERLQQLNEQLEKNPDRSRHD